MNLVTGATGLLGSHIVEQLCKQGRPVRVLARRTSDISWLESVPVEIVYGDITSLDSLMDAMKGVETVYHAAARVGDWGPWEEFQAITIDGTRNVLQACEACGIRRLIHISSISVYGYVDDAGKNYDETTPLGQNLYEWAYYTRAKVAAEREVWQAHESGRVTCTVIRPSWLYGERDRVTIGRLIRNLRLQKAKLIGDGDNRLNVVHAANVAEAAILASDNEAAAGEAFNCSNDGVLTQKQYFNAVAKAAGANPVRKHVSYRIAYAAAFVLECVFRAIRSKKPPIVTRYSVWLIGRTCFFETTKAKKILGWKSTISYEEGIPAAVDSYLKDTGERPKLPTPDATDLEMAGA